MFVLGDMELQQLGFNLKCQQTGRQCRYRKLLILSHIIGNYHVFQSSLNIVLKRFLLFYFFYIFLFIFYSYLYLSEVFNLLLPRDPYHMGP